MSLTVSKRDKDDTSYASCVQAVGENRRANVRFPDGADLMPLSNSDDSNSTDPFTLQYTTDFHEEIDFVHPDLNQDTQLLHDRAILVTTNSSIDTSNDDIAARRTGNTARVFSSDTLIQ